jgi:hypothetical protein
MAGLGDAYRLKAAEMLAKAEQKKPFSNEYETLARSFLRLAEQADRNAEAYQGQRQPKVLKD